MSADWERYAKKSTKITVNAKTIRCNKENAELIGSSISSNGNKTKGKII